MINSFKNPAIMRILRTTERHGAGWREQNFIPGKEVHDCFRDCLIYHFREDSGVHADIQFFGDKNHRFKFRITLAGLQIYDRARVHTEAFSQLLLRQMLPLPF